MNISIYIHILLSTHQHLILHSSHIHSVSEHSELKQTLGPMRLKSTPVAIIQHLAQSWNILGPKQLLTRYMVCPCHSNSVFSTCICEFHGSVLVFTSKWKITGSIFRTILICLQLNAAAQTHRPCLHVCFESH